MAQKTKTREITIVDESGVFSTLFKRFSNEKSSKGNLDLDSLASLRRLLSNEKAKILYTIKSKKPNSIYELSKMLGRDFKSVLEDIKLLQRFGFVELIPAKTGKRTRLKPSVLVDKMIITIQI